jgi:hypothetical protein
LVSTVRAIAITKTHAQRHCRPVDTAQTHPVIDSTVVFKNANVALCSPFLFLLTRAHDKSDKIEFAQFVSCVRVEFASFPNLKKTAGREENMKSLRLLPQHNELLDC